MTTTQEVANGSLGTLRLGYTGTAMLHPLLRSVIRLYQQQYPQHQLQLSEANSLILLERLQRDELDIAIVRPPQVTPANLNMQILLTETMVVALPAEHPCQAMAEIPLLLLQDDFFIVSPASVSSGLFDEYAPLVLPMALSRKCGKTHHKSCRYCLWWRPIWA